MDQKQPTFTATLVRDPLKQTSDDWEETANKWVVAINGQDFPYYTGRGNRKRVTRYLSSAERQALETEKRHALTDYGFTLYIQATRAVKPTLDDVMHCLVGDAEAATQTFDEWCSNFGYDTDSRKALSTYLACQETANKLVKAGIDIEAEAERLADH